MSKEDETGPRRKGKGFFALDVNQFERIRKMNLGIEEAATYLCLLKSTDQSNITSAGGIKSVTDYSGLTRAEAKKAVERLGRAGVLKTLDVERKRARTVPRYSLPIHDKRQKPAAKEQELLDAIRAGHQPQGKVELNAAQRLKEKGYLEKRPDGWDIVEYGNEVAFIPNSFVFVSSGHSPLRRLVTHGELGPVMLAVELYEMQNLMDERGVPTSAIRAYFKAEDASRIGQFRLHRLETGRDYTDPKTGKEGCYDKAHSYFWRHPSNLWADLKALEGAHVIEWAVYSANGKPKGDYLAFNRPQRPLGVLRNGKQHLHAPESIPAFATYLLSRLSNLEDILTKDARQVIGQWLDTSPVIALENQSVEHVEGVGILRMTHVADTENTAVWYRNTRSECRDALFFVEQVARANFPQALGIIQELQAQGNMRDAISMYLNESSSEAQ